MKTIRKIELFAFLLLIISCNNSSKSKKTNRKVQSTNSVTVQENSKIIAATKDANIPIDKAKKYDFIVALSDGISDANYNFKNLELVKINEKIGFIYEDGEEIFPCVFDSVVDVKNNYNRMIDGKSVVTKGYFTHSYNNKRFAKVKQDGKWGLITIDGNISIPCIYDEIYDFDYTKSDRMEGPYIDFWDYIGKIAIVKKDGKWGLINTKGQVLADFIYDSFFIPDVILYYENRAAAEKCGKWGFLNEKGDAVSTFIYDSVGGSYLESPQFISTFQEGMAVVKKDGKTGAVDIDGKEKVPFVYDYISNFTGEIAIAQKNGNWGYINKRGEEVIPVIYNDIKWFEKGLCPVKKDDLWGFLNENGEVVVPMLYGDILVSNKVSVDDGLWFFSQDGYCAVKKNAKWGLIDKDNNTVTPFKYDKIKFTSSGLDDWHFFSNGFLSVQKEGFWSVINIDGYNHIPFEYDDVVIWSEGNVCVKKNNKWGLLDSLGRLLVPIEHKNAMTAGNYIYTTNKK